MFMESLLILQFAPSMPASRRVIARRVLQIAKGTVICSLMAGCASHSERASDLVIPLERVDQASSNAVSPDKASAMVAKARALALAEPGEAQAQAQINIEMLSMHAAPAATQRNEQTAVAGAQANNMSPEEVMERLNKFTHHSAPTSTGTPEDPSRSLSQSEIMERVNKLAKHPVPNQSPMPTASPVGAPSTLTPVTASVQAKADSPVGAPAVIDPASSHPAVTVASPAPTKAAPLVVAPAAVATAGDTPVAAASTPSAKTALPAGKTVDSPITPTKVVSPVDVMRRMRELSSSDGHPKSNDISEKQPPVVSTAVQSNLGGLPH